MGKNSIYFVLQNPNRLPDMPFDSRLFEPSVLTDDASIGIAFRELAQWAGNATIEKTVQFILHRPHLAEFLVSGAVIDIFHGIVGAYLNLRQRRTDICTAEGMGHEGIPSPAESLCRLSCPEAA
jgi:hypothetical protein